MSPFVIMQRLLTSTNIKTWLKDDHNFMGVYPINKLPALHSSSSFNKPLKIVINLDCSNLPGSHWIALFRTTDGLGEVFDSFGLFPPARVQLWCNRYCTRWKHNTLAIQPLDSTLCSFYVCSFLTSRSKFKSMAECVKYVSKIV